MDTIEILQDWYVSANEHDQNQFRVLFGELSEYKRDNFDRKPAKTPADSPMSSTGDRSRVPVEKAKFSETQRALLANAGARFETIAETRKKQMLRMVPTSYSSTYRPWALSPRVSDLLGAHKAQPLLDPFSSILSLTPEDRARLAAMPLARSVYSAEYKPHPQSELFNQVCFWFYWVPNREFYS